MGEDLCNILVEAPDESVSEAAGLVMATLFHSNHFRRTAKDYFTAR